MIGGRRGRGRALFNLMRAHDLEGIVAKRLADPYEPRTKWFKIKNPDYSQKRDRLNRASAERRCCARRGYLLTRAAPAVQIASSCDPVPPEQPIAPMILPSSMRGIPPRDATTSSRLKMYLKSYFCTASSKALVGRRYLAAARALCSAMGIEPSCAPSIRRKATRLAPEFDDGDVHRPALLGGLLSCCLNQQLGTLRSDRRSVGVAEGHLLWNGVEIGRRGLLGVRRGAD